MKSIKILFSQFSIVQAIRFCFLEIVRKFLLKDSYYAYSQTGEDIILDTLLNKVDKGFYVEVGCNEAIQHSNTFKFYQKGWRGITIDANQKMIDLHKKIRKHDIQILAAVSDEVKDVIFYEFEMDEISTIDNKFYSSASSNVKVVNEVSLTTRTLDSILSANISTDQTIDLLSIDVEGHDYQVLNSMNLSIYRPKLIIIEMHNFNLLSPNRNEIYNKLLAHRYILVGYVVWNGYFMAEEYYVTAHHVKHE